MRGAAGRGAVTMLWGLLALLLAGGSPSQDCSAPVGRDGATGRPGRDGRTGQKGDPGDPGAPGLSQGLTSSKGDAGDPGAPGEPGNIGYIGAEGPPGAAGDPGPQGAKGVMAAALTQHRAAFSAHHPRLKEKRLLFTRSVTNEEQLYDGATGEFTCARAGYYYFTFQVVALGDLCLQLWAQRGGQTGAKLLSFCDRNVRSQPQVNSGGSVLNLDPGDRVWIEATGSRTAAADVSSSVFSGFLLYPRGE